MSTTIYVLLCEDDRYYIGKTERKIEKRIEEHFTNNGSYWTKKYKPIKVVETIKSDDNMDEDKYTKKYMLMYGIEKVRGGSYTEMILPEYKILCLKDELCTIDDLCFRCKRSGHFANECYAKTTIDDVLIEDEKDIWCCEYCNEEFESKAKVEIHEQLCKIETNKSKCLKCGRNGHNIDNCYAKTTVNGWCFISEEKCDRCGRNGHNIDNCYAKNTVNGISTEVVDVVNVVKDVGKAASWLWGKLNGK